MLLLGGEFRGNIDFFQQPYQIFIQKYKKWAWNGSYLGKKV